jgi:hypothetical protein
LNGALMMHVAILLRLITQPLHSYVANVGPLEQMIEQLVWWGMVFVGITLAGYIISRAVAIAWFRTKLEYIRTVLREGARRDGEG